MVVLVAGDVVTTVEDVPKALDVDVIGTTTTSGSNTSGLRLGKNKTLSSSFESVSILEEERLLLRLRFLAPLSLEAGSDDDDNELLKVTGAEGAADPRPCEQVDGVEVVTEER